VTALVLAAMVAFAAPRPSPVPSPSPPPAAYYDGFSFPAALGDRSGELRAAIAAVLGERLVVSETGESRPPWDTHETACKSLGVRHVVVVSGGVMTQISSHGGGRAGSKSLELGAWIWDCRDRREAAGASVSSASYDYADAKTLQTMYAALSASLLERIRKLLAEPPDFP
jgi:hypothetical protein